MVPNQQFQVISDGLNFRSSPMIDSNNFITVLPKGKVFLKVSEAGDIKWWRVLTVLNGQRKEGYVSNSFVSPAADELEAARNTNQVFDHYLNIEIKDGSNAQHLSFLDYGLEKSIFRDLVDQFSAHLAQKPDGTTTTSFGKTTQLNNPTRTVLFKPYPLFGAMPVIEESDLQLDSDIKEICICTGSFEDGEVYTHWIGKNAVAQRQFWSATKIVPLLNIICRANQKFPLISIKDTFIKDQNNNQEISFLDTAIDIVSYKEGVPRSNALAAMCKRFESQGTTALKGLESWLRSTTANDNLNFAGYYGENPLIQEPELRTTSQSSPLLTSLIAGREGSNLVSAYDLVRIMTLIGWHLHLPAVAKLSGAQWHSLKTLVRALGHDSARYVDVALEKLGVKDLVSSPVVLSKLGFGRSSDRDQTELSYVALVQFIDERPRSKGRPGELKTLCFALRGTKQKPVGDSDRANREARSLDATVAAVVTEILRRVLTNELA